MNKNIECQPGEETNHSWVIDPPAGSTSRGVCLKCGTTKEFPNAVTQTAWGNENKPSLSHRSPAARDVKEHSS